MCLNCRVPCKPRVRLFFPVCVQGGGGVLEAPPLGLFDRWARGGCLVLKTVRFRSPSTSLTNPTFSCMCLSVFSL